jgi:hypothetical protein
VFGALALALGQDGNWDLRNYHWYNAYAFITNRLMFDVGAAQPRDLLQSAARPAVLLARNMRRHASSGLRSALCKV